MKAIQRRTRLFAVSAFGCIIVSSIMIASCIIMPGMQIQIISWISILAIVLAVGLWICAHARLKMACLIVENQILHIRPAVICEETCMETNGNESDSIDVFISYFGILIDSKVIKYNQEGIRLKAVELGRYYICLSYGTEKRLHKIHLLHADLDSGEIAEIAEKFRYETGVSATITSSNI